MPSDYAGNTLNTATVLQPSKGLYQRNFADRVDSLDPLDYYKFQVAGRSSLSVAIGQLSGDVTLNLLKSDGTLLQSSANSAASAELLSQTLDAGTYYLQVLSVNGNSGSDYALDFALQSNPKTDIAWRHTAGYNAMWTMEGTQKTMGRNVPALSDPNWQMVGVGDFNADHQTDYLWRHEPTGQNAIWLMNNGMVSANVSLITVDPSWRINLAADLNQDGKSDILWQSNTGANVVWYMDGARAIGSDNFLGLADRNWTLSAAGDFNSDGQTDLVWRHGISGENVVWTMRRNTVLGVQSLQSLADQNWQLEGSGDFNGDGQSDLLWHHIHNGQNVVWYMSAGKLVGMAALPSVDPSWKIMGVADRFDVPSVIDRPGSTLSTALNLGDLSTLNRELGKGTVNLNDRVSRQDQEDYYSFTTSTYGAFTFNLTGLSADANLEIFRSDTLGVRSLALSNNFGTVSEAITQTLKPGTYAIRVSQHSGDTDYRLSLSAAPARLQVTSPTANSVGINGEILNITWADNITENVSLSLYKGNIFVTTIANSIASEGSYAWRIPTALDYGTDYQILVASTINPEFRSFSGQNFTIGSPIYKYNFTHFFNGVNNTADYYTGWVYAEKGRYIVNSFVDVNNANNQLGLNGRYAITSGTIASTITRNQLGQVFVDRYYDQDPASLTQYMPWKYSQNQASGMNYIGSEEDSIGSSTKLFGDAKNFTDFGRDNLKFDAWEAPIDARYQVDAAVLGTQVGSYGTTIVSPFGTKGIYLKYSSGGSIHWSVTTGAHTMRTQIEDVYGTVGRSGGFLGLPKTDQYTWRRGVRQDFEGGYIYHDGQNGIAFKPNETPIVRYNFTYFYSGLSSNSNNADYYNSDSYTGWTITDEGRYPINQFVDVNSNLNEASKNGQYYITQATMLGKSSDLIAQDRGKVWVNWYYNQETNENIIPLNSSQAIGSSFLGSEYGFLEFNNNIHFDFGQDAFEFDRFIRVDSPNITQSINAGTTQVISWTDTINENVKIDLYQGNNIISNIANNILSNGSFNWQIPTTLSGSDFRIRVTSMTNATIMDSSDVGFTIVGLPTIQVTSPNTSGISLSPGKNLTITWTDNFADNVKIELYQGNVLKQIIASSVASNGSYTWTLPNNLGYGSDYRIKISHITNATISDFSDSYFSIDRPFNIQFDYRFDTNGWFTSERRAVLEAAADVWESIILDEFADIPIGTNTPNVRNPQTGLYVGNMIFNDPTFTTDVMIDDLLIFVGARELDNNTLGLGSASGYYTNEVRYVGNDFEPWIGSLTFDTSTNWFFDSTPNTDNDLPHDQSDFFSVALHEIGHALGFSADINAYQQLVSGNTFMGQKAKQYNGGVGIPLNIHPSGTYDNSHIKDGYVYGSSGDSEMDPTLTVGKRIRPTLLDIAILDDIGYTVNYSAASQNPV